jgi:hypothetical protein
VYVYVCMHRFLSASSREAYSAVKVIEVGLIGVCHIDGVGLIGVCHI